MEFTIWIGPIDFALHRASVPSLCFRASTYDTPCFHSQIYHEVGPSFLYLRLCWTYPWKSEVIIAPVTYHQTYALGPETQHS